MTEQRRICIIGTRVSGYPRNRTLAQALGVLGAVTIAEIAPSLTTQWKFIRNTFPGARKEDVLFIMYPAEKLFFTALLSRCFFPGTIICDTLISSYDSWVNDRGLALSWGLKALYYKTIDQILCLVGDVLFFDTKEHEDYFRECYVIRKKTKTLVSPIVIDLEEFDAITPAYPPEIPSVKDRFTVLFLGNYIPLQGVEYILRAIATLPDRGRFRFLMVGNGQTRPAALRLKDELGLSDVEFTTRLPHEQAIALMKSADLALGVFGETEKAGRVIPNKLLEAMACHTPVVTGRSTPVGRYFADGREVYYCEMANAQSLADAILRAYEGRGDHERIRAAARAVIEREFSVPALERRLTEAMNGA